jgi:hypothetical protein
MQEYEKKFDGEKIVFHNAVGTSITFRIMRISYNK